MTSMRRLGWHGGRAAVNLLRRMGALEKELTTEPVVLTMPDGRTEVLWGRGNFVTALLALALENHRTPEIELIAQSVSSIEPGGGCTIELARAILNSPVEEPGEHDRQAPCSSENNAYPAVSRSAFKFKASALSRARPDCSGSLS